MKLLIVRLSSFGDIVHAIPAQQQIANHLRDAEIHWLTASPYDSLLCHIPGISRLWVTETRKGRRKYLALQDILALVASLRRERFDMALDFHGLVKSAFLARLSGASRIVGLSPQELREPFASWFYTETTSGEDILINDSKRNRHHVIEINLQFARFLGCSNGASALIPLRIPPEASRYVEENLQRLEMTRPVLIHPGAGRATKLWPARHYANLFLEIQKRLGLPALFTYGPGEEYLIEEIQEIIQPLPVPTFSTNILELAALCRRSRLLVGGDTGPLHLAVALGTPTVALMGSISRWGNGPFHPDDPVVTPKCRSSPIKTSNPLGCEDIRLEEVFGAVAKRLKHSESSTGHCFDG